MFRAALKSETKVQAATRYGAFLIALFRRVESLLDKHDHSVPLAKWWYDYFRQRANGFGKHSSNCERLYHEAVAQHGTIYNQMLEKATKELSVG